jgi:hypothetical protein
MSPEIEPPFGGGGTTPIKIDTNLLGDSPLSGTAQTAAGVTGESNTGPGVSGKSIGLAGAGIPTTSWKPASDGVLGEGDTGVHGVSSASHGVLGENKAGGVGVTGTSSAGDGVYGINGAGSGSKPVFGCGVRGESENGYGVYGASKTASGVYGTSDSGHLAGEFAGDVNVSGKLSVSGHDLLSMLGALQSQVQAVKQFSGTLTSGEYNEWTCWGNSTDVILQWAVRPSPGQIGNVVLRALTVETTKDGKINYNLTVWNIGTDPVTFDAYYTAIPVA